MKEEDDYKSKYDREHMMIPPNTRVAIKLWFANLMDIAIVGGCAFLGLELGQMYSNLPSVQIMMLVVGISFGLFLVIRPKEAPGMRNWRALIFVMLQDKTRYLPIESLDISEDELNEKKEKEAEDPLFSSKKKNITELSNTLALGVPISCTEDGILTFEDKTVARYFSLESAPLFQLGDSELEEWQDALTDVSRQYLEDCSYISLPSKIDTTTNQRYWRYMRQKCGSTPKERRRAQDIADQIARAEVAELRPEQYRSINYYAEIYADNVTDMRQRTNSFILGAGKLRPEPLNKKETIDLLKEINNPTNS